MGLRIKTNEAKLRHFLVACGSVKEEAETGNPQPVYKVDGMKVFYEFPKSKKDSDTPCYTETKQELTAKHAVDILKGISDEDCKALGFDCVNSRPDWMIVQVLPVPPPHVRPSISMDSSARSVSAGAHTMTRT
jgi:DNA-directed RNA polymerase II subunit RPB1